MPAGLSEAVRQEARALLRAHLAVAGRRHHVTRHCPHCHRLLRLTMASARGERRDRAAGRKVK